MRVLFLVKFHQFALSHWCTGVARSVWYNYTSGSQCSASQQELRVLKNFIRTCP